MEKEQAKNLVRNDRESLREQRAALRDKLASAYAIALGKQVVVRGNDYRVYDERGQFERVL